MENVILWTYKRGDKIGRLLILEFNDNELNIFDEMMEVVKRHPDFKRYEVCIFKGSRRKELQWEINEIDIQISNMKKRLSSIVKEYKFDSVQAFYKDFKVIKREYL